MKKFRTYKDLAHVMRLGKDFAIEVRMGKSGIAVMAPHGGGIEPGTGVIADAIAGSDHAYYAFKGIRATNNRQLHIPSIYFDEPQAMAMIRRCHTVITIHGCRRAGSEVYVGGRNSSLKKRVTAKLLQSGCRAEISTIAALKGQHHKNLCNRGTRGKGLQLEISSSLRHAMTAGGSGNRRHPTPQLISFAQTVRQVIETAQNFRF